MVYRGCSSFYYERKDGMNLLQVKRNKNNKHKAASLILILTVLAMPIPENIRRNCESLYGSRCSFMQFKIPEC